MRTFPFFHILSTTTQNEQGIVPGKGRVASVFQKFNDMAQLSKRILYIIPTTTHCVRGGAETALSDLVAKAVAAGYDATVWTGIRMNRFTNGEVLHESGVRYLFLEDFVRFYSWEGVRHETMGLLCKDLKESRYDIIHLCCLSGIRLLHEVIEQLGGVRDFVVLLSYFETPYLRVPGTSYPNIPNKWRFLNNVDLQAACDGLIDLAMPFSKAFSQWLTHDLSLDTIRVSTCHHVLDRTRVLRLIYELRDCRPLVKGRYVLICSRLDARKGIREFLDVVRILVHERRLADVQFVVSAPEAHMEVHNRYAELIRSLIQELRLESNFFSCSERLSDADIFNLYLNCEFTVLPSFYEGYGIVSLESALCGKAVVAYACSTSTTFVQ